jgi:hypothetical protein
MWGRSTATLASEQTEHSIRIDLVMISPCCSIKNKSTDHYTKSEIDHRQEHSTSTTTYIGCPQLRFVFAQRRSRPKS